MVQCREHFLLMTQRRYPSVQLHLSPRALGWPAHARKLHSNQARTAMLLIVLSSCSAVRNVDLGRQSPPFGPFGAARPLTELGSPSQNPTLTRDLLEIYFTSDRAGSVGRNDTWVAKRSQAEEAFDTPELVPVVNSTSEDSSPAISADGLTLWFASNRSGGIGETDIWVSTRSDRNTPWNEPTPVIELNTPDFDLPRPLGNHGLQMPISSGSSDETYRLRLATRPAQDAGWSTPSVIAELSDTGASRVDGFLTEDGTTLLFNEEQPDGSHSEIKRSWRVTAGDAFVSPESVGNELNGPTLNRDPWLSADGSQFFFSSDRTGEFQVYEADLVNDR